MNSVKRIIIAVMPILCCVGTMSAMQRHKPTPPRRANPAAGRRQQQRVAPQAHKPAPAKKPVLKAGKPGVTARKPIAQGRPQKPAPKKLTPPVKRPAAPTIKKPTPTPKQSPSKLMSLPLIDRLVLRADFDKFLCAQTLNKSAKPKEFASIVQWVIKNADLVAKQMTRIKNTANKQRYYTLCIQTIKTQPEQTTFAFLKGLLKKHPQTRMNTGIASHAPVAAPRVAPHLPALEETLTTWAVNPSHAQFLHQEAPNFRAVPAGFHECATLVHNPAYEGAVIELSGKARLRNVTRQTIKRDYYSITFDLLRYLQQLHQPIPVAIAVPVQQQPIAPRRAPALEESFAPIASALNDQDYPVQPPVPKHIQQANISTNKILDSLRSQNNGMPSPIQHAPAPQQPKQGLFTRAAAAVSRIGNAARSLWQWF